MQSYTIIKGKGANELADKLHGLLIARGNEVRISKDLAQPRKTLSRYTLKANEYAILTTTDEFLTKRGYDNFDLITIE